MALYMYENWSAMPYIHVYSAYIWNEFYTCTYNTYTTIYTEPAYYALQLHKHTHIHTNYIARPGELFIRCKHTRAHATMGGSHICATLWMFAYMWTTSTWTSAQRLRAVYIYCIYVYLYICSDIQHKDPGTKAHATHPLVNHNNSCTCWHISHIYIQYVYKMAQQVIARVCLYTDIYTYISFCLLFCIPNATTHTLYSRKLWICVYVCVSVFRRE